jgi:hypothetical protein
MRSKQRNGQNAMAIGARGRQNIFWVFFYAFGRFSARGVQKQDKKYLCKNSMSKTFPKKIDENFDDSFSSFFVCFIAVSGVSQQWDFKNTTKNVLQKNRVEKLLRKNRPKNQNRLFLVFVITFLGVFR